MFAQENAFLYIFPALFKQETCYILVWIYISVLHINFIVKMCIAYNWSLLTELLYNPVTLCPVPLCALFCLAADLPYVDLTIFTCSATRSPLGERGTSFLAGLIADDSDPLPSSLKWSPLLLSILLILFELTTVNELDHIHNIVIHKHEHNTNMVYSLYGTCFLHLKCNINFTWCFYVCIVFRNVCSP